MADGHGGYRRPNHPAPVSGPGALSRRTDGGPGSKSPSEMVPTGGAYGDRQDMQQIQSGASMTSQQALTPLMSPTARPNEPITAGAAAGPGIGPEAAGIQSDQQITNDQLAPLVYSLEMIANLPSSNQETRQFVRALKARMAQGPMQ